MRGGGRLAWHVAAVAVGLLLLVAGALVLLNPRHRSFYFGPDTEVWPPPPPQNRGTATGGGRPSSLEAGVAPAVAAEESRAPTFGLPLRGGTVAGAPAAPASIPAPKRARVRLPAPDGEGRIRVPIVDIAPVTIPSATLPDGWELKEFSGRAGVEITRDEGRLAVRLQSARSSFALHRDVVLDLRQYPLLRWSWKAVRLPPGGDVRARETDDQAGQIYVVIPRWPFPRINSDVVGYLWDTRAPLGTKVRSPQAGNVRSVVVESGYQRLGFWVSEARNVLQDYRELFGREPSHVGKLAIMTDSNDTRSESEVLIEDLVFLRPPGGNAGISSRYAKMPPMSRDNT